MTQNYLISVHSIIHLLLLQNGTVNTILTQIYDNPPYKMTPLHYLLFSWNTYTEHV